MSDLVARLRAEAIECARAHGPGAALTVPMIREAADSLEAADARWHESEDARARWQIEFVKEKDRAAAAEASAQNAEAKYKAVIDELVELRRVTFPFLGAVVEDYQCRVCMDTFVTREGRDIHETLAHDLTRSEVPDSAQQSGGSSVCTHCGGSGRGEKDAIDDKASACTYCKGTGRETKHECSPGTSCTDPVAGSRETPAAS